MAVRRAWRKTIQGLVSLIYAILAVVIENVYEIISVYVNFMYVHAVCVVYATNSIHYRILSRILRCYVQRIFVSYFHGV